MLAKLSQPLWQRRVGSGNSGLLALPSGPSAWLFAASLAFSPLTSLRVPGFSHFSYCDLLFILAIIAGVVERFITRDFVYKKSAFLAALLYIFCIVAISASYVVNFSEPMTTWYAQQHGLQSYTANFFAVMLNAALVPLALFAVRIRSLSELRFIFLVWTASAVYGAAFVVAYCNGYISHYDWFWVAHGRASGLTPHPNTLGINATLALPGLLLLWCEVRSWLLRVPLALCVLIVFKAANLTGSRTAVGALVIVLAVFLLMRSHNKIRGIITGCGALLLALLLRAVLSEFPMGLTRTTALGRLILGAESSNEQRDMLNTLIYHVWLDNPIFGAGFGMMNVAHNVYLSMLGVTGVVGCLGFLLALGIPFLFLLLNRTYQYARNETALLVSAMAALLAVGWIQPSIKDYNASVVFGMALFLALNPYFLTSDPADSQRMANRSL